MADEKVTRIDRGRKGPRFKDISGQQFGWWTALEYAGSSRGGAKWTCRCRCGAEKVVSGDTLRSGRSQSCGCKPFKHKGTPRHGMTYTAEYEIWCGIKKRCFNKKAKAYPDYGGRGITMCQRWQTFENFYADTGDRPTPFHEIDRIDNDGNYEPGNVRWATRAVQCNNRRSNFMVSALGKTLSLADWQRETGIGWSTIKQRINRGWPADKAVSAPVWGEKRGVNCGRSDQRGTESVHADSQEDSAA